MAKKNKEIIPPHYTEDMIKRKNRITIQLNNSELNAIELYCKKYKIKSKSAFIRNLVLKEVMVQFLDDYPTLFKKQELDRLVVAEDLVPRDDQDK